MEVLQYQPASGQGAGAPRRPIVELLALAGPTVAQMASYTVMQFIDTYMLARYGDGRESGLVPTAAANSGLLAFAAISLGVGVLYVVNTLVSQSFGRREFPACGSYLWQGLWFAALYSLLLLPALPLVPRVFQGFGHEPALVELEAVYLQIVLAASLLKLVQTALAQFLLAIDRPLSVLAATVCGVSVNAVAAWAFIFGRLGFAPMGIRGAAWGQNVGVLVEMTLLAVLAARPAIRRGFGVAAWRFRWARFRTLLTVGLGAGAQFIADVLAWSLFGMGVMAQFGTDAMAANNFMMRYMVVSFMPAFGLGAAVTALVGRYIGRGQPEVAARRAHLGFLVAAAYMVGCGLFFYLGRHALIGVFTDKPEVLRLGALLLTFAAVYQFFDAMYIIYNGALRGAGDTLVPALATASLCWGITVGGGYLVARTWRDLGPAGPWTAATGYGIILGLFMFARFWRGGWRKIRLGAAAGPGEPGETGETSGVGLEVVPPRRASNEVAASATVPAS